MSEENKLTDAALYILEHGFTKKEYESSVGGPVCALGAIIRAKGLDPNDVKGAEVSMFPEVQALAEEIVGNKVYGDPMSTVYHWNDVTHRTAEEVVGAMLRAKARVSLKEKLDSPRP